MHLFIDRYKIVFLVLLLIVFRSFCIGAEEEEEFQYDEVTVYLNVQGIGGADVRALIKDGVAYLSISDVFMLLKIKNNPSARLDSLSGFFINTQDNYLIDRVKNQIIFQGKKIELNPVDLFLTETSLYMKVNLFGEVFGLNCSFNFRELSAILTTKLELPLIREMKMEQMRENLRRLKGEIKSDTTIGRSFPLLKLQMVDWAIASQQQQGMNSNTLLQLALGAVVAGGELNVGLLYDQKNGFDSRQQTYLWHYVNDDNSILKQVLVGKIMPQMITTVFGSPVGIQLTNTPSIYRRSYGTYTLSNITEPGWLVELYVNNVLVDFVKADASGFYKFEVPLVYGSTVMMVRMYGPWGEVRTRTENSNIPFNFLPPGELEYTVNAGVFENQVNTKFYRTNVNYGISRQMSIQGGYEYFSSPSVENSLPFIGSSIMLNDNTLIAGEYTFGVRIKSNMSYRLPNNLQFSLNFTKYEKGQTANVISPLQETGVSISAPILNKHFSAYSLFFLSQSIYSDYKTMNAGLLFSGNIHGVSTNVTTSASYYNPQNVSVFSDLSLSCVLPGHFTLRPSGQYDYRRQRLTFLRCNLQKPLFGNGYLDISYEHSYLGKYNSIQLGLRYDFSFMRASLTSRLSKKDNSFYQSASGSILIDSKNKYIEALKNSSVGRSALSFLTFLDLNGNGKRDENEPKVAGVNIRVNGGRIVRSAKDSTIRVIDLTPYTSYLVEIDKNSFQNISWKINNLTLSVYADPNQIKTIEIPIELMGEVAGTVYVKTKNTTRGLGGVYVCFYRDNKTLVARTLTEGDGYYSYMGLRPGKYVARLDSTQLTQINMTPVSELKSFTVAPLLDGDFVEGIDFTIQSLIKKSDKVVLPKIGPQTVHTTDNSDRIINDASRVGQQAGIPGKDKLDQRYDSILPRVNFSQDIHDSDMQKKINITASKIKEKPLLFIAKPDPSGVHSANRTSNEKVASKIKAAKQPQYPVHYGAYISDANALSVQQMLTTSTGLPAIFILEDGVYKLWIVGLSNRTETELFVKRLNKIGFQNCIIKVNPDSLKTVAKGHRYSIQVGAYVFDKNALSAQRKIMTATGLPAIFVLEKGFYKLWIVGYSSKRDAQRIEKLLDKKGFQNYLIKANP